ncbi:MAG: hypothetical protein M3436_17565 [Pseudomonadota bacterium]|nr:hypothetical protein [Pseudomonadota bacterium]
MKWAHLAETPMLVERLTGLACGSLTAVMESAGAYGDMLRESERKGPDRLITRR